MRLTKRGRALAVLIGALILAGVFSLGRVSTTAATEVAVPTPQRSAVVTADDTLWAIATRAVPERDPRLTVDEIRRLNHLHGVTVHVGQQLLLPSR